MYPLQCKGGFPVPIRAGKFEIVGVSATVDDFTKDSQIAIVDDDAITSNDIFGRILGSLDSVKTVIRNIKGIANKDSDLTAKFPEGVKTRHGISIYCDNVVAGSVCVYVR